MYNKNNRTKSYKARNMLAKTFKTQIPPMQDNAGYQTPLQHENEPPQTDEVGYINVGVFTASGALPVKDAVVTLYHTYSNNEEHVLYHMVTDESGMVPTMEVPVLYSGVGQQYEYTYSTYNLRVQAIGYYLVNILDIQVFPNIATNYRINLIPVAHGVPQDEQNQTIVIPPRQESPTF